MTGKREQSFYGKLDFQSIIELINDRANMFDVRLLQTQSNSEGELINWLQNEVYDNSHFLIINPAGLTHTSVALRDAVLLTELPYIEVHLSNIYAREPFRNTSYFSDKALAVISGLGWYGYLAALDFACEYLKS